MAGHCSSWDYTIYLGWQLELGMRNVTGRWSSWNIRVGGAGKSSQAWYEAVWLSSGIPDVCCCVGLAKSGMKLCGWYVKILQRLAIWASKHKFRYGIHG